MQFMASCVERCLALTVDGDEGFFIVVDCRIEACLIYIHNFSTTLPTLKLPLSSRLSTQTTERFLVSADLTAAGCQVHRHKSCRLRRQKLGYRVNHQKLSKVI